MPASPLGDPVVGLLVCVGEYLVEAATGLEKGPMSLPSYYHPLEHWQPRAGEKVHLPDGATLGIARSFSQTSYIRVIGSV
jgi:hypothetical protein